MPASPIKTYAKQRAEQTAAERKKLDAAKKNSSIFYGQPSVYLSGGVMEIEHFRRVRTYEEGRLCLEFAGGLFTVYGDGLKIETLAAHRITLRGRFLRTDFSSS